MQEPPPIPEDLDSRGGGRNLWPPGPAILVLMGSSAQWGAPLGTFYQRLYFLVEANRMWLSLQGHPEASLFLAVRIWTWIPPPKWSSEPASDSHSVWCGLQDLEECPPWLQASYHHSILNVKHRTSFIIMSCVCRGEATCRSPKHTFTHTNTHTHALCLNYCPH